MKTISNGLRNNRAKFCAPTTKQDDFVWHHPLVALLQKKHMYWCLCPQQAIAKKKYIDENKVFMPGKVYPMYWIHVLMYPAHVLIPMPYSRPSPAPAPLWSRPPMITAAPALGASRRSSTPLASSPNLSHSCRQFCVGNSRYVVGDSLL